MALVKFRRLLPSPRTLHDFAVLNNLRRRVFAKTVAAREGPARQVFSAVRQSGPAAACALVLGLPQAHDIEGEIARLVLRKLPIRHILAVRHRKIVDRRGAKPFEMNGRPAAQFAAVARLSLLSNCGDRPSDPNHVARVKRLPPRSAARPRRRERAVGSNRPCQLLSTAQAPPTAWMRAQSLRASPPV
jgi:hypothetical protein